MGKNKLMDKYYFTISNNFRVKAYYAPIVKKWCYIMQKKKLFWWVWENETYYLPEVGDKSFDDILGRLITELGNEYLPLSSKTHPFFHDLNNEQLKIRKFNA